MVATHEKADADRWYIQYEENEDNEKDASPEFSRALPRHIQTVTVTSVHEKDDESVDRYSMQKMRIMKKTSCLNFTQTHSPLSTRTTLRSVRPRARLLS